MKADRSNVTFTYQTYHQACHQNCYDAFPYINMFDYVWLRKGRWSTNINWAENKQSAIPSVIKHLEI